MEDPSKIKYIILDLDQTITSDTGSWIQFTKLLGADSNKHQDIFNRFKAGELTYPEAKQQLIDVWREKSNLSRKDIVEIFNNVELREGAAEGVAYLKEKYHLCIISGAINIFVDVIAQKLGIEDRYAATKFIFDETECLIDFEYTLSRGEEKLKFLKDFCQKYGATSDEFAAIGDGESDMPIFSTVAKPILFIASETAEENKKQISIHLHSWDEIRKVL